MSQSFASNPARVRVDLPHFLKSDAKDLIILIGALAVGGGLLAVSLKGAAIVSGLGVCVFVMSVITARDLFTNGNVCPAVVLDPERQLVGVFTDLSQGGKPHPVIQVLKKPLRRVIGSDLRKGTRLAFVAMYTGKPGAKVWNTFGGYLVNTGTRSQKSIQRVVASIDEDAWQALKSGVRTLETPFAPGLYHLQLDDE